MSAVSASPAARDLWEPEIRFVPRSMRCTGRPRSTPGGGSENPPPDPARLTPRTVTTESTTEPLVR
jgi:hypothetical protein